jgi:DNA-binding NarL/FixJ family response regulator
MVAMSESGLRLVGRDAERMRLRQLAVSAREGVPSTLLLHGEAGIGKTALVKDLLSALEPGAFNVLYGTCLRFGAEGAALLPLSTALTGWLRETDSTERARLFPGVQRGEDLISAPRHTDASSDAVLQWSRALDTVIDSRPTVLIVDDLQWADQSTLDALTYLCTGLRAGTTVAILGTYRDTDLQDGHRLRVWLADVWRLPGVHSLALPRLDPWATEELVSSILPLPSSGQVVDSIYDRSRGNPFLTELLARTSDTSDLRSASSTGGADLRDAVLGTWHRLGPVARQVTQLLSAGGQPVEIRVLRGLAAQRDIGLSDFALALDEAVGKGVAQVRQTGELWFVHPLFAEVLGRTVPAWELADLHLQYAHMWSGDAAVGPFEKAHRLALHYEAAGRYDDAYLWSLQAAGEAGRVGATDIAASHLARAVDLHAELSLAFQASVDVLDLQRRAAEACERAGRYDDALRFYEGALARIDRTASPLDAARMLLPLPFLRAFLGGGWGESPDEWLECVRLCEGLGPTSEEAMAWANIAFGEVFTADVHARAHAQRALDVARQAGSRAAVAWATGILSQTEWGTQHGLDLSLEALESAGAVGDTALLARTAVLTTNCYQSLGQYAEAATVALDTYVSILAEGQRHDAANIGAVGAQFLLALGRFDEAQSLAREILSFRQARRWSGHARCVAAIVCARRGEVEAADRHLQRAHELMPGHQPVGDPLDLAEMQVMIDLGRPWRALDIAKRVMAEAVSIDAITADEYLLWAAQAAADLAAAAATVPQRKNAQERLRALEGVRAANTDALFASVTSRDLLHPAYLAMYRADRARSYEAPEPVHLWDEAVVATRAAGLRYEQARCGMHLARRLLSEPGQRQRARHELRECARQAADIGATSLLEVITRLAAQAHIDLDLGRALPKDGPTRVAGVQLTVREGEVLSHLSTGETYSEIARALYISEKTVSSHVSHLLRKTGTRSRIELVDAAMRERPPDAEPTPRSPGR